MNKETGMFFKYDDNTRIYYEKTGNGDITVLLIHGFACSHLNWRKILPVFKKDEYSVYTIDLKGYGESSRTRDNKYSLANQSDIIEKFILFHDLRNLVVIGHSMGGGVALHLATSHISLQERLQRLILMDSAAYNDFLPLFVKILSLPVIRDLTFLAIRPKRWIIRWAIQRIFYDKKKVTDDVVDAYVPYFYHGDARYVYVKTVQQLIPDNYREMINRYRQIKFHTLVIWGENDPVIPLYLGKKLHDNIPGSSLKIIPRCGHNIQEEKPEETMQIIADFLAEK
ncbi:MAG: alpha/beta fold hydrolase [Bacteroidota bacterium]